MKKIINIALNYIGHLLIYFCCYINSPAFCAYLIKISILRNKFFQKKIKKKKIIIVLDRAIGRRDIEIIQNFSNNAPEFMFLRRSITKVILLYFSSQKKFFFNYLDPPIYEKDYFEQNESDRNNHEIFWKHVIYNLKKIFKNKFINLVTFNYTYFAEIALYSGCRENNVPVKLWHKEGIKTDLEAKMEAKTSGVKYKKVFSYFSNISVYNKLVKKMFVEIDKSNSKKIGINGFPRMHDYIIKKKYRRKINSLLFLSFNNKKGIPRNEKNKGLNWNTTYMRVVQILNNLSKNKNLNIMIKIKSNSLNQLPKNISKEIKIFKTGTAHKYINKADIVIGHNSTSTIEALVNGKHVMVPFFEKKRMLKKYLYKFNKEIIYTSEKNMEKKILKLMNKYATFPLKNQKHRKTIEYYLGNTKNISQKYLNFLSK